MPFDLKLQLEVRIFMSAHETDLNSPITEVAWPLFMQLEGGVHCTNLYPLGTCFAIAESLVVTAAHNIDEAYKSRYPGRRLDRTASGSADFRLVTFQRLPGGQILHWSLDRVYSIEHSDLCLLRIAKVPGAPENPFLVSSAHPPFLDQTVAAFGYADLDTGGNLLRTEVEFYGKTCPGSVIEVMVKPTSQGPSFVMDGPAFLPGMSGGPIMDENGRVIGVISRSAPDETDGGRDYSVGCMIWPILLAKVEGVLGVPEGTPTLLIEIAKLDGISVEGFDRLDVTYPEAGRYHASFRCD
jgi:hypothetical protein